MPRSFKIFNVGQNGAKGTPAKPEVEAPKAEVPSVTLDLTEKPKKEKKTETKSAKREHLEMAEFAAKGALYEKAKPRIDKINALPIFNQPGGETPANDPSEWGEAYRALNSGEAELAPATATQLHSHSAEVANQLDSFIKNVPSLLENKAAAHDKAANDIEKLVGAGHPDADFHRGEARTIRTFLGTNGSTEGTTVRHDMRKLRDDIVPTHSARALDRNLEFAKLANKIVDIKGKLGGIKGASGEFKLTSPTTLHPALQSVHSQLNTLNDNINRLIGQHGVFTPVSRAKMALVGMQHDALQGPRKSDDVMSYQDEHPDSREENKYLRDGKTKNPNYWSKPGHIWGDPITEAQQGIVGVMPGGRDQIAITADNLAKLRKRSDKTLFNRMKGAMATLKRGQAAPKPSMYTTEGINSVEDVVTGYKNAAERQALRTKLNPPTGGLRRMKVDPKTKKSVSTPVPGTSPKLPEVVGPITAQTRVNSEISSNDEREGHIKSAIQGMYLNDRVEPEHAEGAVANLSTEDAEKVAKRIIDGAQELQKVHSIAVKTVRGGGRISKAHRTLLGPLGVSKVMADVQRPEQGAE